MPKSRLHLIAMYVTEALAILCLFLWLWSRDIVPLLFAVMMTVITATFHVTYLLASLYEKMEKIEELIKSEKRA